LSIEAYKRGMDGNLTALV